MILDTQNLFSDDQALTATAVSTNVIDLGAGGTPAIGASALGRQIGLGEPVEVLVQLTVDSGGTSPTLDVDLQQDTTAAFSSATVIASAAQIAGGSAGDRASIQWIPHGQSERFLRLNYTLGGTTPTYTVTSGIVLGTQTRPQ